MGGRRGQQQSPAFGEEPRAIAIAMPGGGFGLPQFDYQWTGYRDGHGSFDFARSTRGPNS